MSADESSGVNSIPVHVAFVMDGNGRWATRQGLPRLAGHRAGIAKVEEIAGQVAAHGVRYMTLYMFSTENWKRSKEEIDDIFELLTDWLTHTGPRLRDSGVSLRHLGRREPLPSRLLDALDRACGDVSGHRLTLCMAINYGGRAEIVDAVRAILSSAEERRELDESTLGGALYTSGMPDPDLLVRPGGEMRLSNFLLWQAAYAELYFSPVLWPDFGEEELDLALHAYAERRRRFGGL